MSVASSEVWQEGSWINALPFHPIFKNLSDDLPNENDTPLLCESRGDIFVWNPSSWSIMTTNLKRLHAQRDESMIYQNLHPTITPPTQPIRLLPSLSGHHLALIGECYVNIIELRRQRGPWGEFGGGVHETDCRVIPIGQSLIRAHCLIVLQTQWHPEDDKVITILTSDGVLRLFSIIQPSIPQLSLYLSLTLPSQPHSVRLDEEEGQIITFALLNDTAFLLQDKMDLQTIPLKEGGQPSSPLPMYPLVEDNYSGNGCGLLVLPTQPPVIVIGSENCTILHCVFVSSSNEEEIENGDDDGMICVIEKIVLPENELSNPRLISDPLTRDTYFIQTSTSIYHVYIPWLHMLDQFSQDVPSFTANPPCTVTQLFHCTDEKFVTDTLLVSDGTLGEAVIAVCNDGSCWTISSLRHLQPFPTSFIQPDKTISAPEYPLPNEFVEHIRTILYQAQQEPVSPLPKSHKQSVQKDCFDYVQYSIQVLRKRHLIPQVKVRAILTGRVKLLAKKRERQIEEVMSLEEKQEDIDNDSKNLQKQLTTSQERCTELIKRVERVVCLITSTSPILSDAEKTMARDLQSIHEQLSGLHGLLQKAQAKVALSLGRSEDTNLSLSDGHMDTVLNTIQDDGTSIKESVQYVKQLALAMDMVTVT